MPTSSTDHRRRSWLAAFLLAAGPLVQAAEPAPLSELPYSPGLDTRSMDLSADPCEDFFQYSCGGWIENNPIPADRAAWDVYRKVADENLRYLWGILESAAVASSDRDATRRLIGDYFAACMDTGRIESLGLAPLAAAVRSLENLDSPRKLAQALARLHAAGGNGSVLFELTSLQDFHHPDRMTATFFVEGLGLPDREYYLSPEPRMVQARARYRDHVANLLGLAGWSPADASAGAGAVLRLETLLAKASLSRLERRDLENLDHPMSVEELARQAPGFDWGAYLEARGLPALERVNVTEPAFLAAVGRIAAAEPVGELRALLFWGYLRSHAGLLPKALADEHFDFNSRYLLGIDAPPPRWRECVENADADLGEALGRVFVERTFPAETRRQARQMIETIQSVMAGRIRELDWMSDATKERALEKLAAVRNKVGHPDRWRDYSGLEIRRDDHFGNRVRSAAFEDARRLAQIGRPVDLDEWEVTPQTVNAWYEPLRNEMVFPAGILQPPLFDVRLDAAPSWGNTGMTIGHELVHGFDDRGRDVDAHGHLADWWTPEDEAGFERRARCIVEQYGQYTVVDDIRLNSRLTLGEDIADLAGTLLAYLGWKAVKAGQALEPRDGLTPEQRFFVGSAQWACGHETVERARARAVNGVHSPLRHRVNGVFVNMPEFAAAFRCQGGQAMVKRPEDLCRVW